MELRLDMTFYRRVAEISWLSRCGKAVENGFQFPVHLLDDRTDTLRSMFSLDWADANTHARGQLTSYLSRTAYEIYGTTWNSLVKQSRSVAAGDVTERIMAALEDGGWAASLARTLLPAVTPSMRASLGNELSEYLAQGEWDRALSSWILTHVHLAALESAYRSRFPKAPVFFETILQVYEAGHLPCGWVGSLTSWPSGTLMVH
jgi:hypothetical protein